MQHKVYKVVDLVPNPDSWCGSFKVDDIWGDYQVFTCFPISPLEYRKEHSTKAKLVSQNVDNLDADSRIHTFVFLDDWGTECTIQVDAKALPEQLRLLQLKINQLPKDGDLNEKPKD